MHLQSLIKLLKQILIVGYFALRKGLQIAICCSFSHIHLKRFQSYLCCSNNPELTDSCLTVILSSYFICNVSTHQNCTMNTKFLLHNTGDQLYPTTFFNHKSLKNKFTYRALKNYRKKNLHVLTLSQTTIFRLFQTEGVCRRQFQV